MEECNSSPQMLPDPLQHLGHRIGTLVSRRRVAAGLTQRQLADAVGISLGTLRDLEQCRTRSPRRQVIEKIAAMLGFEQSQVTDLLHEMDRNVRIEVLGPLTARLGAGQVPLGSARQRTVLGLLALHRDSCLHRDAIIEVLWGERPPASAVTELQGYISRLRKLLRTGCSSDDLITTAGVSYCLVVGHDQLDAAAFTQCARNAQRAAVGGNPERACGLYERALSLWRGEVLADIDLLRQHPAVTALSCRRSDAVLGYATAAQFAHAHGEVLPHLRGLCARERFNEQAHARLMIALAATGQQAAALQIFAEIRDRLDGELGICPSGLLAEAHTRVLRQQIKLPALGNAD
jgi:DNA-binding SARP family transcriptional activator/DNA-binding XRE family transcriptional regulator